MADFALELSFDPASDAAVRRMWQALADAGIPSQADNARGMVNAPHLCLAVAREIPESVAAEAKSALSGMLPAALAVRGMLVLGETSRVTLALLAEPDERVTALTADLRRQIPAIRHPVWTPHVTLGRRIPRERIGEALAVVEPHRPRTLTADRLRWWDPTTGAIETLVQA